MTWIQRLIPAVFRSSHIQLWESKQFTFSELLRIIEVCCMHTYRLVMTKTRVTHCMLHCPVSRDLIRFPVYHWLSHWSWVLDVKNNATQLNEHVRRKSKYDIRHNEGNLACLTMSLFNNSLFFLCHLIMSLFTKQFWGISSSPKLEPGFKKKKVDRCALGWW